MDETDLNFQATQTSDEMSSSTEQNRETSLNGTSVKTAESSNQPDKARQTQTKENDLSKHMTQIAADALGGNLKQVDKNKPIDPSYQTVNEQHFENESLDVEMKVLQKQPDESKPKQEAEEPKQKEPEETEKTDKADEASAASGVDDKKEANNDDDSGVNLAEFFRAKENIDAHIETKGKGDGLDDALVKCLSKTPGVRIIRKGFLGRFGEPAAIRYRGVTMSFHNGHVVASGEDNVRGIVQDLLEQIKSTVTASDNSEHKDAEVDPQTGELTIGECTYKFPVPREDIIVLIQNSDGDSAFAPDELKKSTSFTHRAAHQLMILSKTSTLFPQCCPDLNEESIIQMQSNSSDPEKSKNNVYPIRHKIFHTVSGQLNVVSHWVDNSTDNILQQDLEITDSDLLLNIYDAMCAQAEEVALDQQNQARNIHEKARKIAERTINEYNLLSGQKLEENSEIAAKAFLKELHINAQIPQNFNDSENTHLAIIRGTAQIRKNIMQIALEAARQARNASALNTDDQVQQPPAEVVPQNNSDSYIQGTNPFPFDEDEFFDPNDFPYNPQTPQL